MCIWCDKLLFNDFCSANFEILVCMIGVQVSYEQKHHKSFEADRDTMEKVERRTAAFMHAKNKLIKTRLEEEERVALARERLKA